MEHPFKWDETMPFQDALPISTVTIRKTRFSCPT